MPAEDNKSLFPEIEMSSSSSVPEGKKGRGPSRATKEKIVAAAQAKDEDIISVFEYWIDVMKKRGSVILDAKRKTRIGWAVATYGIDAAKKAILGCSMSDFHMGRNKAKTLYNDISVIFRDADQVEKFVSLATVAEDPDQGDVDW